MISFAEHLLILSDSLHGNWLFVCTLCVVSKCLRRNFIMFKALFTPSLLIGVGTRMAGSGKAMMTLLEKEFLFR